MRGQVSALLLLVAAACAAAGQEFQPPRSGAAGGGTRVGLFGFGVRTGVDFTTPRQLVLGATLDIGNLFIDRLRLRPSGEIGVDGADSYVVSFEGVYRFAPDDEPTIPYLGIGLSVAGHDGCGLDPDCPDLWANLVLGFERRFRATFNWLLEYHAMDAWRRHRLYLGLVTRRGG
jgi:hypothetical protein